MLPLHMHGSLFATRGEEALIGGNCGQPPFNVMDVANGLNGACSKCPWGGLTMCFTPSLQFGSVAMDVANGLNVVPNAVPCAWGFTGVTWAGAASELCERLGGNRFL